MIQMNYSLLSRRGFMLKLSGGGIPVHCPSVYISAMPMYPKSDLEKSKSL